LTLLLFFFAITLYPFGQDVKVKAKGGLERFFFAT